MSVEIRVIAVFSMRSFDVSMGKFGGIRVISGSLQSTLLQEKIKIYIKKFLYLCDILEEHYLSYFKIVEGLYSGFNNKLNIFSASILHIDRTI